MNIFTTFLLLVGLGLVWILGKLWWWLPMPQFSKIMLTLSLFCVIPGMILVWNDNAIWGSALLGVGGLLSGVESYVRRGKKDKEAAEPETTSSKLQS